MSESGVQTDRLEETWRKLRDVIRQRELELTALKQEFEILDQARALVILRGSGNSNSPVLPQPKRRVGLKDAICAALSASEVGLSLDELVDAVSAKVDDDRYASERSLQAAVQTTVRRMLAAAEVMIIPQGDSRRYLLVGEEPPADDRV